VVSLSKQVSDFRIFASLAEKMREAGSLKWDDKAEIFTQQLTINNEDVIASPDSCRDRNDNK
jgi:phosphoribosylaminoimidazole-succinocarboxamide synthase